MRSMIRLFALLMVAIVITACSGETRSVSSIVITPTRPAPEPTPTNPPDLPLSQTITDMMGGQLTVAYPEGWGVRASNPFFALTVFNNIDVLQVDPEQPLPEEHIRIIISVITPEIRSEITGIDLPEEDDVDDDKIREILPAGLVAAGIARALRQDEFEVSEYTEVPINGEIYGRFIATHVQGDARVYLHELGDYMLFAVVTTAEGEFDQFQEVIERIVTTSRYVNRHNNEE